MSASEERKFIHDISNPLTIAQGMLDSVIARLAGVEGVDPEVAIRLEKAAKALERINTQIKERRAILVGRDNSAA